MIAIGALSATGFFWQQARERNQLVDDVLDDERSTPAQRFQFLNDFLTDYRWRPDEFGNPDAPWLLRLLLAGAEGDSLIEPGTSQVLLDVIQQIWETTVLSREGFAATVFALDVVAARRDSVEEQARALRTTVFAAFLSRHNLPPPPADDSLINRRVPIEGGPFVMGSPGEGAADEHPQHYVEVPTFLMQEHEVTIAEFQRFDPSREFAMEDSLLPVVDVSWFDAVTYAAWLGGRLPTEAEWEYAARAGTNTPYYWGTSADSACVYAKGYGDCDGYSYAAPVGSFSPNGYGLYDMAGNVWEWVQDCWHDDYQGAPADGSAWTVACDETRRVLRGGGFDRDAVTLYSASPSSLTRRGSRRIPLQHAQPPSSLPRK